MNEVNATTPDTARDRDILASYDRGEPVADIAARYNLNRSRVYQILREHGIAAKRPSHQLTDEEIVAARQSGEPVTSIAERAGLSTPAVYAILRNAGLGNERKPSELRGKERRQSSVYLYPETDAMLMDIKEWSGIQQTEAVREGIRLLHAREKRKREMGGK